MTVLTVADQAAWEGWLETSGSTSPGVWLRLGKEGATDTNLTYAQALDAALCFGWIDSQKRGDEGPYWQQRFTPRKPKGIWSQINTAKAEALIAAGRMRPAGQAQVDQAKADGRWANAYAGARTIAVPDDLRAALDASPQARAFFDTLNSTNRFAILFRIQNVKKAETRARKIAEFVAMLDRGGTIHP